MKMNPVMDIRVIMSISISTEDFRRAEETAVRDSLKIVDAMPNGIIRQCRTKFQTAVVEKRDGQVRLYFVDAGRSSKAPKKSGYMSRMDIERPFELVALYTRAMLLSLLWKPDPAKICVLGFGGGRLAMYLHYWYRALELDCVEIDADVIDISAEYFAMRPSERIKIILQDAREYIETVADSCHYDCIYIDCFTGAGHQPDVLSTLEFYLACIDRLNDGGVVAVNILKSDPLFSRKAATFVEAFPTVRYFRHSDANILFGMKGDDLTDEQLAATAEQLESIFGLSLPLTSLKDELLSNTVTRRLFRSSVRRILNDDLVTSYISGAKDS